MADTLARSEPLDEACRLVGRFLKHYAIMEQALDSAIGKLLGLQGGTIEIISANIPVAKKSAVLFSAEKFLAAIPVSERRKFLKNTRSRLMELNNHRVIIAHCPFDPAPGGGISFRRVVASEDQLKITAPTYSANQIEDACKLAIDLANDLDRVAAEMKPYQPGLDFSDTRNSVYIGLL